MSALKRFSTLFCFLFVLASAAHATEYGVTLNSTQYGTITSYSSHHSLTGIRNLALLGVAGLEENCTGGVFIDDNLNKSAFFILHNAISSLKEISLVYDTSKTGPWGDTRYCAIVAVTLVRP